MTREILCPTCALVIAERMAPSHDAPLMLGRYDSGLVALTTETRDGYLRAILGRLRRGAVLTWWCAECDSELNPGDLAWTLCTWDSIDAQSWAQQWESELLEPATDTQLPGGAR